MPSPYHVALSAEVDVSGQRLVRRSRQAFARPLAGCLDPRAWAVIMVLVDASCRLSRIRVKEEHVCCAFARGVRGKIDG